MLQKAEVEQKILGPPHRKDGREGQKGHEGVEEGRMEGREDMGAFPEKEKMRIDRVWAMPNKYTFTIKPIKQLLDEEIGGGRWLDPFAGMHSPVPMNCRNDLDPEMPAESHKCALEFLRGYGDNSCDGVLYDPPYSITQAKQYGKKEFSSMKYWAQVKNEMARIIKTGGKAICCGWTSMGLGKNRRFEMMRILLCPHGGSKNDTIVTVEIKKQNEN